MSFRLDDILRDLPPGLTEADIVDLVDGEVPPDREALIIDALQRCPMLSLVVKQLRNDRAGVQAVGELAPAAPPHMLEAIQAKLDREALAELVQEAEEATAPIPISRGVRAHGGIIRVLAESPWARRVATAASLAIVGALGVLGARELARRWPRLPTTVAINSSASTDTVDPKLALKAEGTSAGDSALAATDANGEHADVHVAGTTPAVAATDAKAEAVAPLTATQAVDLARQGRLVVAVQSRRPAETLRHLETLSRAAPIDLQWRAHDVARLPTELALLATPLDDLTLPSSPLHVPPTTLAADHVMSNEGSRAPGQPEQLPRTVVKALHVVRMGADASRLNDLLRDLNIGNAQVAEFRVLPAPINHKPSLDAENVLWWAAGSEHWTPRIAVPIMVETVE